MNTVSMSGILIRQIRPGDGEGCARAWTDAGLYYASLVPDVIRAPDTDGLVEWFETDIAARRDDTVFWTVAEKDGQVAGFIEAAIEHARPDSRWQLQRDLSRTRLLISALAVTDQHRRLGIGTALLEAAEEWGRQKGAIVAITDTNLHSPLSVPFYEDRMGYLRQAIILRKPLSQ